MRSYTSRDPNSPLGVAAYLVITSYAEKTDKSPTGLYFNKVMSLLHNKIKADGYDLQLPHCWYKWGDEVVRYLMPVAIGWNHEDPPQTTVTWKGRSPESLGQDELSKKLIRYIDDLTKQYSAPGGVEKAVDEVYALAPFEFQRRFKKCRDSIYSAMRRTVDIKDYGEKVLWPLVESACKSFLVISRDFPEVAESLPSFKASMEYVLHDRATNYPLAYEISEEFWSWFCYFLRLHPKAHENVPRETLDVWEEKLDWETERYKKMFGDHIVELASKNPNIDKHQILREIADTRRKVFAEERDIIASFDKDFDDLDKFLREVKRSYRAK